MPGDPLQWLFEDTAVYARYVFVWFLLPNRWTGGCRSIFTSQCNHWDQTSQ